MIFFDKPRVKTGDERILPLVNVVFLLLVFVMITGEVISPDPFGIEPPYSIGEGKAGTPETVVYMSPDFRISLDGIPVALPMLRHLLLEKEDLETIRLKADGRMPASRVVEVLDLLASAGVREVDLVVVSEVSP